MHATLNGVRLSYTDEGRGVPLLFVHGFPLSRGAWQKQIDELRTDYRVIAPDLRGFGESEASAGTATMSQFADDLRALLQELATGPVVLVGHSMGGLLVRVFANQYPDEVVGMVLVDPRGNRWKQRSNAASPSLAASRTRIKSRSATTRSPFASPSPSCLRGTSHFRCDFGPAQTC